MRTKKIDVYRVMKHSLLMLSLIYTLILFANGNVIACPIWTVDEGIQGGVVTSPTNGAIVCAGSTITCTATVATDNDLRSYMGVDESFSDVVRMYWRRDSPAPFGYGTSATWTAPMTPGTYQIRLQLYDVAEIPEGETGTRDDPAIIRYIDVIVVADTGAPIISNVSVSPSEARVGDTATITFSVSKTLAQNPAVTVNGHTASCINSSYTYTYVVQNSDPNGYANIEITAIDPCGQIGYDTNKSLWIVKPYTYTYNDTTGARTVTNANGTSCVYTYDERYRLKQVKHKNVDGSNMSGAVVNYTVDGVGNRTEMWFDEDAQNKKNTYGYDEINRLISANYYSMPPMSFTYDWVGNRTSAGVTNYTYDDADRLLPLTTYSYWGTGSLHQILGTNALTFEYDPRELLSTVQY